MVRFSERDAEPKLLIAKIIASLAGNPGDAPALLGRAAIAAVLKQDKPPKSSTINTMGSMNPI